MLRAAQTEDGVKGLGCSARDACDLADGLRRAALLLGRGMRSVAEERAEEQGAFHCQPLISRRSGLMIFHKPCFAYYSVK